MQLMQQKYEEAFQHIADILFDPTLNDEKQKEYNKKRLADFIEAVKYRPFFLPVQIPMPAEIQTLPISKPTPTVDDNVIITGAITDGEDKKINFRRNRERAEPFVANEGASTAQISLEAIAGKALESGGLNKIQGFYPLLMREDDSLEVSVIKPVETNTSDLVTVCFTGVRVMSQAFVNDYLTPDLIALVMREIENHVHPENRWVSLAVKFDADGKAKAETPKADEPLYITGYRSTFLNAKVNLSFKKEGNFAKESFPLWALAAEPGNAVENFKFLKYPLPIKPQQQLFFEFENTIDGSKYAENGELELLRSTV